MKKEGKRDGFAAPDLPRGLFGRLDGCRVAGKSQGNVGADGLRGMVMDDRQCFHTVALRQNRRNLKARGDLLGDNEFCPSFSDGGPGPDAPGAHDPGRQIVGDRDKDPDPAVGSQLPLSDPEDAVGKFAADLRSLPRGAFPF